MNKFLRGVLSHLFQGPKGDSKRRLFLKGLGLAFLWPLEVQAQGPLSSPVGVNRLRPPGAIAEEYFPGRCIRCGRCAEICPYRSIVVLDIHYGVHAGTPLIFVERVPCYLCMKCVQVCPTGTLRRIRQEETRMGTAVINRRACITWQGQTLCRTCYNVCPFKERAIHLDQLRPVVDERYCTGCGLCTHGCPLTPKAINIEPTYSYRPTKW